MSIITLNSVKLWSSSAFMVLSKKKRLCRGKDLKHRYDSDGHVHKSRRIVRDGVVVSDIYIYIYCNVTNS
jgi:hypothetical protein